MENTKDIKEASAQKEQNSVTDSDIKRLIEQVAAASRDWFETAFEQFLESDEVEQAYAILIGLLRSACIFGWEAAGGKKIHRVIDLNGQVKIPESENKPQ